MRPSMIENGAPISSLLIEATYLLQFVLDQERNNMSELNSFFFAVGKARDALSFHQRLTFVDDLVENCR